MNSTNSDKNVSTKGDKQEYIFRMTITLKNGKVIRRANGRPFKIPVK